MIYYYDFNGEWKLENWHEVSKAGGATKENVLRTYEYDSLGRVSRVTDCADFATDAGVTVVKSYTYDNLDRVLTMTYRKGQDTIGSFSYTYDKTVKYDTAHRNNFFEIDDCHGAATTSNKGETGEYQHFGYQYPKTPKYHYSTLKTILDDHFTAQIEKVKADFAVGASSQNYDLESFYTKTTDGAFTIRKNQDGGTYADSVVSGTESSESMTIKALNTSKDNFTKINFKAINLTIHKSRAAVKEPVWPVIRKITIRWETDGLTYTGFLQEISENAHAVKVTENPDQKSIEIAITENNLSDDSAILDGLIGYAAFEDGNKSPIVKRIEIKKEN